MENYTYNTEIDPVYINYAIEYITYMERRKAMKWIDMHCDTLSEVVKNPEYGSLKRNRLSVDIERLKQAGAAQFFACYVNAADYGEKSEGLTAYADSRVQVKPEDRERWDAAYEAVLEMTAYAGEECGAEFQIAKTSADISSNRMGNSSCTNSTAGILTVEEGGVLNGSLSRLDELYEKGVRLVTLTWNYENCIGYPNSRDKNIMKKGLTDFGIQTVERMNELGMIVDVSHLSDGGFWDCIRYSRRPIAASHSNARSLCRHPRNLSDEMLRALGENGGAAGLNFYSAFLRGKSGASPEDIAEHAVWMIGKGGEDTAALGTDFDGFNPAALPAGVQGVQDMEKVWDAMRKKGITPRQLDKIAYGNVMRVIREVWK